MTSWPVFRVHFAQERSHKRNLHLSAMFVNSRFSSPQGGLVEAEVGRGNHQQRSEKAGGKPSNPKNIYFCDS